MSDYERAVQWVIDRLEGVGPAYRRDVALTTREMTAGRGLWARSLELVALVGLALRLRSRSRTENRPSAVWEQGAYVSGVLLVMALACAAWAHVAEPTQVVAGLPAVVLPLVAGGSFATGGGCALRGHRAAAALLATVGGVALILATPRGAEGAVLASTAVVAVGSLLIGKQSPGVAARGPTLATCALPGIALPVALGIGPDATVAIGLLAFTAFGPAAMVAAGWFDPRLAAAATTLVLSRVLASGFDEIARALAVLAHDGQGELLVRWLLMCAGVLGAWLVTRSSIRRLASL